MVWRERANYELIHEELKKRNPKQWLANVQRNMMVQQLENIKENRE
jgi:hypothetical protein